jgi:hypothetical protein
MEDVPIMAHRISFLYSAAEDRLVLLVDSRSRQRIGVFVTRRLVSRLLNSLASLLERSSLAARQAPYPLRGDVVLLEHQGAVQAGARQAAAAPSPASAPEPQPQLLLAPTLLTAIDISTKPSHFSLTFRDARQALVTCDLTRAELHRVVKTLLAKVSEADWAVRVDAAWLEAGQQSTAFN